MPTVAFDVIGTLFSLDRPRRAFVDAGAAPETVDLWFAQSLRDYFAWSHAGAYAPLAEVLRATLPRVLAAHGIADDEEAEEGVMAAMARLEPVPDAAQALRMFSDGGWRIIAVTNGAEASTHGLLAAAGLRERFFQLLSCDDIGVSKPHPRVYEWARGAAEGELWMLAAHAWDVAGALRSGLKAAWVSQPEGRYPAVYPEPNVTAPSLAEAARHMMLA
ncbi:haloacid dehalogenase type II [soil metagenome]